MIKFLRQTLASFLGSITSLIIFFGFSFGGLFLLIIILTSGEKIPEIKAKSALVLDFSMEIKDSKSDTSLAQILSSNSTENITLREVTEAIKKAAKDDRITAIFLDGRKGNLNVGYASLNEIKSALEIFKASGKKIIAYHVNYTEKDYFVSSISDNIVINPMGLLEINGFSSSQLFLASALDKYGIGVQVIRAGKFKAAVEPFIRNNFSEESTLQTEELLTNLWQDYTQNISKNRKLTPQIIENIANTQPILTAQKAQELKLVDNVFYFDQVVSNLQKITAVEDDNFFRNVSIKTYLEAQTNNIISSQKIAVFYTEGTIVTGKGEIDQIGSDFVVQELEKIRKNDDIKAVVLRINSPGGSAIASDIILRELQLIAKEKPIIISMGDVAASGGYWIATAGEKIFAENTTITGSIGVFGLLFNLEKIAQNNGINYDVVKTNEFADLGVGLRSKTQSELQLYQTNVDGIYNLFLTKVSEARNLTVEEVNNIAQGRVWSGKEAKKIGLVDEIGGLDMAIQYTAKKLNLGDNWQVEEYPEKRSWETELVDKLSEVKMKSQLTEEQKLALALSKFNTSLDIQEILENPNKIYTILPFKLEIK